MAAVHWQKRSVSGNSILSVDMAVFLIWPMPLTLLALFGILKNRFIGFIASMMTFATLNLMDIHAAFDTAADGVLLIVREIVIRFPAQKDEYLFQGIRSLAL